MIHDTLTAQDIFFSLLILPYVYLVSWVATTAYFHVKFDYHKRFLKSMEGRE